MLSGNLLDASKEFAASIVRIAKVLATVLYNYMPLI